MKCEKHRIGLMQSLNKTLIKTLTKLIIEDTYFIICGAMWSISLIK